MIMMIGVDDVIGIMVVGLHINDWVFFKHLCEILSCNTV